MKSNPAIFCLFFGLSLALIYRHPKNKNSVGAFDNREPENGAGPLEDIDQPDTSVFRNLENIYEMVLEAKNEVDDLKDGVTQEYEKILRRYQKQAAE